MLTKKMLLAGPALLLSTLAFATAAVAVPINITISDNSSTGTGWYSNREDQEVEPGCVATQAWDLEAFVYDAETNALTLYSGYNILAPPDLNVGLPGDIFFDTDGNAVYGLDLYSGASNGNFATISNAVYNYNYVIDLGANGTYQIYELGNSSLLTAYYRQNDESNPWRYQSGGTLVGTGSFAVQNLGGPNLTVAGTTLTGGTHYATSFNVGFLGTDSFTAKFTMQCGNDNIIGQSRAVPEPGTLLLLGTGLLGLGLLRRRKQA